MNVEMMSLVMIPQEELTNLKTTQQEILRYVKELQSKPAANPTIQNHITAKESWQPSGPVAPSSISWY